MRLVHVINCLTTLLFAIHLSNNYILSTYYASVAVVDSGDTEKRKEKKNKAEFLVEKS